MGKNRKLKQVINQLSLSDSEENEQSTEVPVEFLTSDDFQVVQKKRHHKRSVDTPEDFPTTPRSRHNSCRVSFSSDKEQEEGLGCHSSFWSTRSQNDKSATDEGSSEIDETGGNPSCNSARNVMIQKENAEDVSCVSGADSKWQNELSGTNANDFTILQLNGKVTGLSLETNMKCNSVANKMCSIEEKAKDNAILCGGGDMLHCNSYGNNSSCTEVGGGDQSGDGTKVNIQLSTLPDKQVNDVLIEDSSSTDACIVKAKSHKKKKKQKQKTANNTESFDKNNFIQADTTSCSDCSPTECPYISLPDLGSKVEDNKHEEHEKQLDRKRPSKKQFAAIHEALRKAKEMEERLRKEEEARNKMAEEAERLRQEKLKLEQEKKEKKKQKEKLKREKMKAEGRLLSKSQKQSRARMEATLEIYRQQGVEIPKIGDHRPRLGSYKCTHRKRLDSSQSDQSVASKSERHKTESLSSQESKESFSDLPNSFDSKDSFDFVSIESSSAPTNESDIGRLSGSEDSDIPDDEYHHNNAVATKLKESVEKANLAKIKMPIPVEEKRPDVKLRSPVVCVLGHVDTGKTKLLDYIRKTHVQDSEAGGITQQIGATMIPQSALKDKCKMVKDFSSHQIEVPGLLVIDTPGHESFRNLRFRGTSLCDIAILVVDIMHGLQAQTLESIRLLKVNKIPFVVALNKVDRIYGWKSIRDADIVDVINSQSENTLWEFKKRCQDLVLQFANECLNVALFYENGDHRSYVSMVPTSAITGDGMGNILDLITHLTQMLMHKHLQFSLDLNATVLEVKAIPGLGTTIDVILVNGQLHEGDTIVLAGQDGPIVTQIRSLLMPQPLKELRVKNPYIDYKMVEGAQGVKISGKDLDKTLAGMPLFVAHCPSNVDALKAEVSLLLSQTISNVKTSERGVYVQASTLGSLEALLDYLTSAEIPYFGIKIGPVVKKDVMKASIMLEHDTQYATILAFDVKIERDAQELADNLGVKILQADIIYHLFDMFVEYRDGHLKKQEERRHLAIFPCILTLLGKTSPDAPLDLHVTVEAGTLKQGTPLCIPKRGNIDVGCVTAIQVGGVSMMSAKEGDSAVITVDGDFHKAVVLEADDNLISRISRQSIDVCKEYYRDELCPSDWHLMSELKKLLHNS